MLTMQSTNAARRRMVLAGLAERPIPREAFARAGGADRQGGEPTMSKLVQLVRGLASSRAVKQEAEAIRLTLSDVVALLFLL